MAEIVGTTAMNVSRWELAQTTPSLYYRRKLSDLYQKSLEWLFPLEDEEPQTMNNAFSSVFHSSTKLLSANEFYGRRGVWIPLANRLRQQSSTSIIGQRRIGKTWLLQYLGYVAPNYFGSDYHIGYIDATQSSCATLNDFTAAILVVFNITFPATTTMSENLASLEKKVKASKNQNEVFVLCIDEFEGLCDKQGFLLNMLEQLRALTNYGLCLVIASRRPLINIIAQNLGNAGKTSPFFNVFEQITLQPFIRKEAEAFAQDKCKQAGFTDQEYSYLMKFGQEQEGQEQWFPLRLQMAGGMMEYDKYYSRTEPLYPFIPDESGYWQAFAERLEATYHGVMG